MTVVTIGQTKNTCRAGAEEEDHRKIWHPEITVRWSRKKLWGLPGSSSHRAKEDSRSVAKAIF